MLRHKPEQYGFRPDGEKGSPIADDNPFLKKSGIMNITKYGVLKSWAFWVIATAFFFHIMPVSAVMTHIMPYFSTIGIERTTASFIASSLPILTIVGRIGFGWLGDSMDKRMVVVVSFALTSAGVFLLGFATVERNWVIVAFIAMFGIGWGGAVPMIAGLLRAYFGRQRLGTIVGLAGSVMMAGMMVGAPLAGWVFDKWGRYQPAWFLLAVVVGLSGAVFYACLKNRSTLEERRADERP
jgi:MFS family permease